MLSTKPVIVTFGCADTGPAIATSGPAVHQVEALVRGAEPDVRKLISALLDAVQGQAKTFFGKYLQKSTIGDQPVGFLEVGDFDLLFAPIPDGLSDTDKQDHLRAKRAKLAQAFLPFLQQTLIRQFVVRTLATHLDADQRLTEVLLTDLLTDPSNAAAGANLAIYRARKAADDILVYTVAIG